MNSTKVEFLGRAETAKVLGVSERTVLDYGQKGKLKTAAGIDPATKQPCVLFHAGDVERLKFEREQPPQAREPQTSQTLQTTRKDGLAQLAQLLEGINPPCSVRVPEKVYLTFPEASAYSGLPQAHLKRLIEAQKLPAQKTGGGWRIRRTDLEKL